MERKQRNDPQLSTASHRFTGGNGGNEADSDNEVGAYDGEGPPVPIPNTEVKLIGGDNTCLATDREDSTVPTSDSSCEIAAAVIFIPVARQVLSIGISDI